MPSSPTGANKEAYELKTNSRILSSLQDAAISGTPSQLHTLSCVIPGEKIFISPTLAMLPVACYPDANPAPQGLWHHVSSALGEREREMQSGFSFWFRCLYSSIPIGGYTLGGALAASLAQQNNWAPSSGWSILGV